MRSCLTLRTTHPSRLRRATFPDKGRLGCGEGYLPHDPPTDRRYPKFVGTGVPDCPRNDELRMAIWGTDIQINHIVLQYLLCVWRGQSGTPVPTVYLCSRPRRFATSTTLKTMAERLLIRHGFAVPPSLTREGFFVVSSQGKALV